METNSAPDRETPTEITPSYEQQCQRLSMIQTRHGQLLWDYGIQAKALRMLPERVRASIQGMEDRIPCTSYSQPRFNPEEGSARYTAHRQYTEAGICFIVSDRGLPTQIFVPVIVTDGPHVEPASHTADVFSPSEQRLMEGLATELETAKSSILPNLSLDCTAINRPNEFRG
ncbi:MAG TPA: hypothetical protein VK978_01445 [Candidatus Saccharimonadales bacterium]|nr:hypothetical protein [Candidatus Saccharimonadales bacterium]